MTVRTVEPRRLYREVADRLRKLIDAQDYTVGSCLPPERDLALRLGASRSSMREALVVLEVEGRVDVRMGVGVFVCQSHPAAATSRVSADGPFDVIQARLLIEGELAATAAQCMNAGQVAGLRLALRVMKGEARRGVMPIGGDRTFHLRIAEASGNAVLQRLVGDLFDQRNNPLYARLDSHFEHGESWTQVIAEHGAVVDAIARHAPDEARAAMKRHLQCSQDRFAAAWEPVAETMQPVPPGLA